MQKEQYLDIVPEVQSALKNNEPVVALESTILSHGMPYPENVSFAAEVEKVVRAEGAVPATMALIGGRIKVGLNGEEHQLHHDGEQDQGNAVVGGKLVQNIQQITKGNGNNVGNVKCENH